MACNNLIAFISGAKYGITLHVTIHREGTHETNLNQKERRKRKKACLVLRAYRITTMQVRDMSVLSENHKKSHHWKMQVNKACFLQT